MRQGYTVRSSLLNSRLCSLLLGLRQRLLRLGGPVLYLLLQRLSLVLPPRIALDRVGARLALPVANLLPVSFPLLITPNPCGRACYERPPC